MGQGTGGGGTRTQNAAGRLIRQARQAGDLTRAQANRLTEQVLGGNLDEEGVASALGIRTRPVGARVRR